jgi:hypothetical protein
VVGRILLNLGKQETQCIRLTSGTAWLPKAPASSATSVCTAHATTWLRALSPATAPPCRRLLNITLRRGTPRGDQRFVPLLSCDGWRGTRGIHDNPKVRVSPERYSHPDEGSGRRTTARNPDSAKRHQLAHPIIWSVSGSRQARAAQPLRSPDEHPGPGSFAAARTDVRSTAYRNRDLPQDWGGSLPPSSLRLPDSGCGAVGSWLAWLGDLHGSAVTTRRTKRSARSGPSRLRRAAWSVRVPPSASVWRILH